MRIKVESLGVQVKQEREYTHYNDFDVVDKLEGTIKLSISGDKINNENYLNATQFIEVNSITKELQQELIGVIKKIENELNS